MRQTITLSLIALFACASAQASEGQDASFRILRADEIAHHQAEMGRLKGEQREQYRNRVYRELRERAAAHGYTMPETPPWTATAKTAGDAPGFRPTTEQGATAAATDETQASPAAAPADTAPASATTTDSAAPKAAAAEPVSAAATAEAPAAASQTTAETTQAAAGPAPARSASESKTAQTTGADTETGPSMPERIARHKAEIEAAADQQQAQQAAAPAPQQLSPATRRYREQMHKRFEAFMAQREARQREIQQHRQAQRQTAPAAPTAPRPAYPQAAYPQQGYPRPSYPQPAYPRPAYPQPAYPQPPAPPYPGYPAPAYWY
jgi:hypothetical protein